MTEVILRDGDSLDRALRRFKRMVQRAGVFSELRRKSLVRLGALDLQPAQLELEGAHPALGRVTLRQLLAAWTAHDLTHLVQVSRTMAKRYREEVGPWAKYLSVMR